jgi:hypothetical protein
MCVSPVADIASECECSKLSGGLLSRDVTLATVMPGILCFERVTRGINLMMWEVYDPLHIIRFVTLRAADMYITAPILNCERCRFVPHPAHARGCCLCEALGSMDTWKAVISVSVCLTGFIPYNCELLLLLKLLRSILLL